MRTDTRKRRKKTNKELERMERKIRSIYHTAHVDLQKKTKEYFKQFEKLDEQKRVKVALGEMKSSDYRKWRRNKMLMGKHWTRMMDQAAKSMHNANKIANAVINDRLPNIYLINYNGEAFTAQSDLGGKFSFEMINQQAVTNLIKAGNKSLLPMKELDPAKDIPWNMQKVNNAALQGIIQGESIPKIAERIASVTTANEVQSIRAARTLVTRVENQAVQDVAKRAADMGCIVTKSWIATNDAHTRQWHRDAFANYGTRDKSIPWDEPFIVMGEEIMRPGIDGSPKNVYNCRCASCNWYQGFEKTLPEGTIRIRWK